MRTLLAAQAESLRGLADEIKKNAAPADLEALEQRMTVAEEKILAALWSHATDEELVTARCTGRARTGALSRQNDRRAD